MSRVDLEKIAAAARAAGEEILDIYSRDFEVELKADDSPLTEADRLANAVIMDVFATHYPEMPVISEENREVPYNQRSDWSEFWLVDPLDGTKEFVKKNGEFTVNIALVRRGVPVAGVVYLPVDGTLYCAESGAGAFKTKANGKPERIFNDRHYSTEHEVIVVASRSHLTPETDAFVEGLRAEGKVVELLSAGSSLKLCLVAEGAANVYPRFGPTMEWDTGAAHAVVLEAGRKVLNHGTGEPLSYNKPSLLNPWFVVE
ncbi:MAG: 3'(2'),5'-bisphosphate nucleotidase CysQ [Verrucomicrobiales bacterium]